MLERVNGAGTVIVDLSHVLDPDIPMFPDFPPPEISTFVSREASRNVYDPGTEFLIQRVTMIGNTGTYLDAPFHRYADGADLASLDLARLCHVPGVMVDVSGSMTIDAPSVPEEVEGCAVLFQTGWDSRWGSSSYLEENPHFTAPAAEALRDRGAVLVGIDSWNVDDVTDMSRPVHSILLAAGIPVVENLTGLNRLPARGFRFNAPVLPLRGGTAVSVRAFAVVEEKK